MTYALDTNIIIRYLRNAPNVHQNFNDAIMRGDNFVIPKAVNYEIRRGFRISHAPRKEATYDILVEPSGWCALAEMDVDSWKRAEEVYAELYKKGFTIGEIDILIGAFCLVHGHTLVTHNTRHFEKMDGLDIVNWDE